MSSSVSVDIEEGEGITGSDFGMEERVAEKHIESLEDCFLNNLILRNAFKGPQSIE
jgi:hypothetical protein